MTSVHHAIQVTNHELLAGWQVIAQQLPHHVVHHARMKNTPDQGHQQHNEREERKDRIGGNRECKSVHVSAEKIFDGKYQQGLAFATSAWLAAQFLRRRDWYRDYGFGHGRSANRIKGLAS